ncbi:MAG: (Fe-S)-binding protein [Ignavibacteriales bacterium]|nr:(Fe-S)-binding protein [Ignavibacteriales bacterium]
MGNPNPHAVGAFEGVDIPSYDAIINCIHCGLCLPHCPTYVVTGLESSSPRGRIRLIKSVADGDLPMTKKFAEEMDFCLDCQACETACPAGVKYGSLVEAARAQIFQQGHEPWIRSLNKRIFLSWFFRQPSRLHVLARILRLVERSGLQSFLQRVGVVGLFSSALQKAQGLSPPISSRFSSEMLPEVLTPPGSVRRRVGFLTGCIMDVAYADVNMDTVDLLLKSGCEVVTPRGQGCCGSVQAHNGDPVTARLLAKENILVFERQDLDAIVMNSAGCGAYMKEYGHVFQGDSEWSERAAGVARRVKDITEFLDEIGFQPSEQSPYVRGKRVTYHDACHLVHTQKISEQPRRLLKSIRGLEYVELPEASWCCGSAGIYNVTRYDDSMKFLRRKIEHIKEARPDVIVTGNPGCMVQIQHGLREAGIKAELVHTATFLRRACEA